MDHNELVLERFHIALVASIERSNPNYLHDPFTIAEIYQDLIPYRTHRDLIGVAMNGDYEHGLMRLLAGQSNYLTLESSDAREALEEELGKTAPDTGMFKRFGAVKVRLNPDLAGTGAGAQENTGVAKLFLGGEEVPPEPVRRWGLGVGTEDTDEDRGPRQAMPLKEGRPGPRQTMPPTNEHTGPPQATPPKNEPTEAYGFDQDEVGSSQKFWEESRKPLKMAGDREDVPDMEPAAASALKTENRRLKILLAERVLEVEELREQLKKGNRRALQGDP